MYNTSAISEAEKLYTEIYSYQSTRRFMIDSLRRVICSGLPNAQNIIANENKEWAKKLINNAIFKDMPDEMVLASFTKQTQSCIQSANAMVEAISLIFDISIFESTVYDLCRVTALVRPFDWESHICNKQITLKDICNFTYGDLYNKKLNDYLLKLERKPLLEKLDILISKCHPPVNWILSGVGKYDRKRVEHIDQLRNEIVHGNMLSKEWTGIGDLDLYYLQFLELELMELVKDHYGVKVNPMLLVQ